MAFNMDNNVSLTGRIETQDLSKGLFKNQDGSRKMRFTLAVQDNFTKRDGSASKQDIPVEAFIPASQVKVDENGVENYGVYSTLRTGDLVSVAAHIEDNTYEKDGKTVYGGVIVRVDSIRHREPKSVADARAAQKALNAAEQA